MLRSSLVHSPTHVPYTCSCRERTLSRGLRALGGRACRPRSRCRIANDVTDSNGDADVRRLRASHGAFFCYYDYAFRGVTFARCCLLLGPVDAIVTTFTVVGRVVT